MFGQNAMATTMASAMQTQSKLAAFGGVMPYAAAEGLMAMKGAQDFKSQTQAMSDSFGNGDNYNEPLKSNQ